MSTLIKYLVVVVLSIVRHVQALHKPIALSAHLDLFLPQEELKMVAMPVVLAVPHVH